MSRHHVHRRFLGAGLALAFSLGLGACGKEAPPSAPAGEESRYIFPQVYPKPSSVLPQGEDVVLEEPEEEGEPARKTGETPTHAGRINTYPTNTRSRTTYDSGPIQ